MDFTILEQWKLFLGRCEVGESTMPEDQRREMKRAFFGACGQMLFLLRDNVSVFPELMAAKILEKMVKEIERFWNEEQFKQSGNAN
jgi:hypothetical protein